MKGGKSMFSKRHYEAIAKALGKAKSSASNGMERVGVSLAVSTLALRFAEDNPNFRPNQFLKAVENATHDQE